MRGQMIYINRAADMIAVKVSTQDDAGVPRMFADTLCAFDAVAAELGPSPGAALCGDAPGGRVEFAEHLGEELRLLLGYPMAAVRDKLIRHPISYLLTHRPEVVREWAGCTSGSQHRDGELAVFPSAVRLSAASRSSSR